ncbi:uncharacterized protein LOC141673479 [Apium graveolens]|uniref:uncharacterized protein LOC141673479 n=1 Tax=Apium graveolens TaxID=4045 RepID=UPI003D7A5563
MANFTKLEFEAFDITRKNYLSWILDIEIHLAAQGLGDTIKEGNKESESNRAKAMIFLRRHLHERLKTEYLTVKDPLELWKNLKDRYDHQNTVILPKARYDWMHLRLQDFKTNHESRPPGSSPFPEVNAATYSFGRGRGHGRGNQVRNNYPCKQGKSNYNPKFVKKDEKVEKDKRGQKNVENICYRCGMKGHWSCTCRMPKHLADLYKASQKEKGKIAEANLAFQNEGPEYNPSDMTHLHASDFYEIPEGSGNMNDIYMI